MSVSGARAFRTGAVAAKARARPPRCSTLLRAGVARRQFHASWRLQSTGNGGGNGDKPSDGSAAEHGGSQDDVFEPVVAADVAVGRARSPAANSLRSRQARRRIAQVLPPTKLPNHFFEENVFLNKENPARMPMAFREDAVLPKSIKAFRRPRTASEDDTDLDKFFRIAYSDLVLTEMSLSVDLLDYKRGRVSRYDWSYALPYERMVRLYEMLIETAEGLIEIVCPPGATRASYTQRPWWWWDVQKDLDHNTHMFRNSKDEPARIRNMRLLLMYSESFNYRLADAILDIPPETFDALSHALRRDVDSLAPSSFDAKTGRRPINIFTTQGYGGRGLSENIATLLAWSNGADLIRLNAYDLSVLIGDYLGQNWAYSRGAVSMLGFRAAELGGRLSTEPQAPSAYPFSRPSDDENDDDTEVIISPGNVRSSSSSLDEELQKIRQGAYDCFNKLETLKIDRILEIIVRSAHIKAGGSPDLKSKPVIIHLHDIVELSMTMEGTVLLNRLRAIVDAAWQQGFQIIIFGTSASEEPSEEYQSAVRELSAGDLVITRRVSGHGVLPFPRSVAPPPNTLSFGPRVQWNFQAADYAAENIDNVNKMLRAIDSPTSLRVLDVNAIADRDVFDVLRRPILPASEVYHLANTYKSMEETLPGSGDRGFTSDFFGRLLYKPPNVFQVPEIFSVPEPGSPLEATSSSGDMYQEARYGKLNEYEKRIAGGQVKRENLRIAFGDVHVPDETVSALKLLTSLALVRPDAFSYGVLAADRIPGCLLYGPPGTGKTMLAKAVAKESGANMLEISGASINDKWVGESEKLIRAVFTMAKRLSPCVVFIDEADSILANRTFHHRASHRELINQFLKEWDGIEETNAFIMVATNRPFDLDDAVLRRLPRKLLIDLPTKDDRAAILRLILRGETVAEDVDLDDFAKRTPLYSGSDLKNVCVAAAMAAVEEENNAAAAQGGDGPLVYPDRRTLRRDHFERGVKQIPASISEDMSSLKMIRKFDEEYGKGRKTARKSMGFGVLGGELGDVARVRHYEP